jgi:PAS domain S-box-containing protein
VSKAIEYIRTLQDIVTEKSRMRALINHLAGGVMATDAEKVVALANPAFLKMMGYRGDGIGCPVAEIVKDDRLNEMIDQAMAMTTNDMAALTAELSIAEKDQKEERIVGVRCVPFRDRAGRNLGVITVLHDITALKKMDQLKSDFVSMVAHEIRSPMNTVLAQHKVILDGLAGPITEKQQDLLGKASEKIRNLAKLASELLDLARIESGLITQEKARLDLAEVLAEQVEFHQTTAEAQGLHLMLDPLPDLPAVLGNKDNIDEVLSNLITNAVNYTSADGRIRVSADVEEQYVRISVEDTGVGIDAEDLDRVFDRFYRVKNDRTQSVTGTGLGLAIVKSIVEAHDGIIRVESTPHHGSTFHVYLPIIQ